MGTEEQLLSCAIPPPPHWIYGVLGTPSPSHWSLVLNSLSSWLCAPVERPRSRLVFWDYSLLTEPPVFSLPYRSLFLIAGSCGRAPGGAGSDPTPQLHPSTG